MKSWKKVALGGASVLALATLAAGALLELWHPVVRARAAVAVRAAAQGAFPVLARDGTGSAATASFAADTWLARLAFAPGNRSGRCGHGGR